MHVVSRASSIDVENISTAIWIWDNTRISMASERAPGIEVSTFKGSITDHGNGGAIWIFRNGDVIDEELSFFEHAEDEFTPLGIWTNGAGGRSGTEGVILPEGAVEFITVCPSGGERVISIGVDEFESGTSGVGLGRPSATIKVAKSVGRIIIVVTESDGLATAAEITIEWSEDGDTGVLCRESGGVI